MCGLIGIAISERSTDDQELRAIGDLFTRLLTRSEHRGLHATGVAMVNANGDYHVSKAPVPASDFVRSNDYEAVMNRLDSITTLLMGHTRWPTRGTHLDNRNNHPLVGECKEPCIITHNGHVTNHQILSRLMGLKREAQVDSEVILRLAEKNTDASGIDPVALAEDISLCHGRLSAVVVSAMAPTKILLIKGNQPLEVRYSAGRGLIVYASETEILSAALSKEPGWDSIPIPAWRLVVVDTLRIMPLVAYPIPRRWDDGEGRSRPCP